MKSILHPNRRKHRITDTKYKAWIASLPCVVCWTELMTSGEYWDVLRPVGWEPAIFAGYLDGVQESRTQAAHAGDRGFGQKALDSTCIPLCEEHHGHGHKESAHTLGKNFWKHHGLDRDKLIAELNQRYLAQLC